MPDGGIAEAIAKDLIEFCRLQWIHFASRQAHHESETVGDDRQVCLPHAGSSGTQHERSRQVQFEPNLGIKRRQGPHGKGKGGAKIARRARARKAKASARTRERASMAKVHREVWPTTTTLWARAAGTMAIASPGTGMSAGVGFGDGTNLLISPKVTIGHHPDCLPGGMPASHVCRPCARL